MLVRELRVTYTVRPDIPPLDKHQGRLEQPKDAAALLFSLLASEPVEVFVVLCLTTKLDLIAYHELSRGTLDAALVHPREVFKAAILANSASVVLGHNHPSGEVASSADDEALTTRLVQCGQLLGIEVLDHIIVGHGGSYLSFKETGNL